MEYLRCSVSAAKGKIEVGVGFGVSCLSEAPANRQSASLRRDGLRACQARRSGEPGLDITQDGHATHIRPALLRRILSRNSYL